MSVVLRSGLIGLAVGLRSVVTPAALSWALSTGRLPAPGALRPAADPRATTALLALALLEIGGDKLPNFPPRTLPPIAAWRLATGAVLGGAVAASLGGRIVTGTAVGAAGAAIGIYGGYASRTEIESSLHLPEPFPGTIEDALAVALALRATRA